MKLNLNQSALEYLWNQLDSDVQIELSTSVIQSFAKHHLKGVINDKLYQELLAFVENKILEYKTAVKQEIEQELNTNLGTIQKDHWNNYIKSIKLHPTIKAEMQTVVKDIVHKLIVETVVQYIKEIDTAIDKLVTIEINRIVKEKIKEKMDTLLK